MSFALHRCCNTSIYLKQYETSTDAVIDKLGLEAVELKEFNCCGYPIKNFDFRAQNLASARNLSLAEKNGLDILTFCNCCYGTMRHTDHLMKEDADLRNELNTSLAKEELRYEGKVEVKHLLDALYRDIGIDQIKGRIIKPFDGLKIAIHYGCHILRPKEFALFDEPGTAAVFDQLVEITGVEIVPWQTQQECCGSSVWGIDDDLAMDLSAKKLADAKQAGADYLCVSCSYCQLQFDRIQRMMLAQRGESHKLPSILFTQLLGLSLGIDSKALGIDQNELDMTGIMNHLA